MADADGHDHAEATVRRADAGTPAGGSGSDRAASFAEDLPAKAADTVDLLVDNLHDRLIRPVLLGARAIVFGLLISVLAVVAVVVLCIGLLRVLDVYIPGHHVWISDCIIGGLFSLLGFVAWSQRTARGSDHSR